MIPYDSILITGGKGMLAHAIIRNLGSRGLQAVAVDIEDCDITRPAEIQRLFAAHHPTLVINCAAHTKVDLCETQEELANQINGHAVGFLAEECRKADALFVHFSTDFVFNGQGTRPYRTDDPTGPLSAYGRSKLLGEQKLVESAPRRWIIARTAWLYGRDGPSFPRTMVERGKAGAPLRVVNDQIGSPTYTEDLASATLELIDHGATGMWHLTNSGQTSWFDFAKATLEEFNVKADVGATTSAEWFKIRPTSAVRPSYSVLDVEPFAKKIGHPMRPWREALRDFAAAVGKNGF